MYLTLSRQWVYLLTTSVSLNQDLWLVYKLCGFWYWFWFCSEKFFTLDDSENESTNDLSEDTDHIIPESEDWQERKREDSAIVN
jgi:hypothetical protein